ncbi:MAG: ECF transporter S component [Clostridia bacterium]|nr:ECF transporter S component [Clostridia bacterium]
MKKTLWITRTAVLIAMLVLLQSVTKAGGQFVTGSCVNAVLAVAVLFSGLWSGVTVAVISPFLAFLLGIGPQLLPIVPAIAIGNVIYVLILHFLCGKRNKKDVPIWRQGIGLVSAAACKFLALYLIVVQLLCRILTLPEKQAATFTAMFSWPQLVTALIGGVVALLIVPTLHKAFRR